MKRPHKVSFSILALVVMTIFGVMPAARTSAATPANTTKMVAQHAGYQSTLVQAYGNLPLRFEANQGQTDASVKFLSRGGGYTLFLTGDEAVFSLAGAKQRENVARPFRTAHAGLKPGATIETVSGPRTNDSILRMKLVGANPNALATGIEELHGKSNYFIGNDPKKWRTNVPTYTKVRYSGVYPGVDLVYYGNQGGQLEYDFVVAPGADPNVIMVDVAAGLSRQSSGKDGGVKPSLQIDAHGDLILRADGGDIRFQKPVVYQEKFTVNSSQLTVSGEKQTPTNRQSSIDNRQFLDGHYTLDAQNRIGFRVGAYDRTKPLVIDPAIAYSTLLGGTLAGTDANAVATYTDPSTGHVYACVAGVADASDFPIVNSNHAYPPGLFVIKFDPSASGAASVIYSTFIGPGTPTGIAVDSAGNAYVTGNTKSSNFPTVNAYQPAPSGQLSSPCDNGQIDPFLAKLSADGSALMYSTYFGGTGCDSVNAIALDSAARAYIAGFTFSTDLPTVNPFQGSLKSSLCSGSSVPNSNGFVAVIDTTLIGHSSLVYSTYLGGSGHTFNTSYSHPGVVFCDGGDMAAAVAVDRSGGIHVAGVTKSNDFPIVNGFQNGGGGFYSKLNPNVSGAAQLVYSTYTGTSSGVALDSSGNAYVASGLISKINPSLSGAASLVYSTSLLSEGTPSGIAVDALGNAFVLGNAGPGIPLVNPVQGYTGEGVVQSLNAGQSWTGLSQGLSEFRFSALAVDVSTSPRTLYASTFYGAVFSSADGGLNWNKVFQAPNSSSPSNCDRFPTSSPSCIMALAVDPTSPSNVYAGTTTGVYKSSDRGANWSPFNNGLSSSAVQQGVMGLTFDDDGTLYAGAGDGLHKLSPGASSWASTTQAADVRNITIDPTTAPHTIYTSSDASGSYKSKSSNGVLTWDYIANQPDGFASKIAIDTRTSPATLFGFSIGSSNAFWWSSADGGSTWSPLPAQPSLTEGEDQASMYVDTTTTPSSLYAKDSYAGIYKSINGGNSWILIWRGNVGALAVDPTTANGTAPITLYAGTSGIPANAFVAELNPSGTAILFSTYLGGIASNTGGRSIALDSSDNIYVAGTTSNPKYFPTVNAFQPIAPPLLDASGFFTKIGNQALPENSQGSVTTQVVVPTGTLAITFPSITGSTTSDPPTLTVTPLSSTTTANFSLSNNLGAYDISTTAEFSASSTNPVTLCFQALTVNDFSTFSNLAILHIVNGSPVNATTSYNFATRTICGAVTSFSPFVLVKGAAGQLNDLVRTVNESNIRHGIANALDAKIQNAIGALTSAHNNSYGTVCNLMGAFVSSVQAQEGQAITLGEATAFISAAKQIKATLGCQ